VVVEIAEDHGIWCRNAQAGGEDALVVRKEHLCLSGAPPLSGDTEIVNNGRMLSTKVEFIPAK
jgi:hypothetical protein